MEITRKNYEIYFTDYLDGTLSPEQSEELKTFLLLNPELKELLDDVSIVKLKPTEIHFSAKDSLKKSEVHECIDYYAIAASEDVLTTEEQKIVARQVNHSEFNRSVDFYKKIKLQPEPSISFDKKKSLYHHPRILWIPNSSIAALILLLLGIGLSLSLFPRLTKVPDAEKIPIAILIPMPINPVTDSREQIEIQIISSRHDQKILKSENELSAPQRILEDIQEIFPMRIIALVGQDHPERKEDIIQYIEPTAEIFLSDQASVWKPSGSNIRSSDIFTSMFQAGKIFSDKIKEKIAENRSNKFLPISVIK